MSAVTLVDLVDIVVDVVLAAVAAVLAGLLLRRGRHGDTAVVGGRMVRQSRLWVGSLLLLGLTLLLRAGDRIVPTGWHWPVIAAMLAAGVACLAVIGMAAVRSRRP